MPNDLLKTCTLAHSRYLAALEKQKFEAVQEAKNLKRKLEREEIANVREKQRVLETMIQTMKSDIETYSIAAEKEQKFELLSKANTFRDKVKEKKKKHFLILMKPQPSYRIRKKHLNNLYRTVDNSFVLKII